MDVECKKCGFIFPDAYTECPVCGIKTTETRK